MTNDKYNPTWSLSPCFIASSLRKYALKGIRKKQPKALSPERAGVREQTKFRQSTALRRCASWDDKKFWKLEVAALSVNSDSQTVWPVCAEYVRKYKWCEEHRPHTQTMSQEISSQWVRSLIILHQRWRSVMWNAFHRKKWKLQTRLMKWDHECWSVANWTSWSSLAGTSWSPVVPEPKGV